MTKKPRDSKRYREGRSPYDNYPIGVEGPNKRPPFKAGENAEDEKRRARKLAKRKR